LVDSGSDDTIFPLAVAQMIGVTSSKQPRGAVQARIRRESSGEAKATVPQRSAFHQRRFQHRFSAKQVRTSSLT